MRMHVSLTYLYMCACQTVDVADKTAPHTRAAPHTQTDTHKDTDNRAVAACVSGAADSLTPWPQENLTPRNDNTQPQSHAQKAPETIVQESRHQSATETNVQSVQLDAFGVCDDAADEVNDDVGLCEHTADESSHEAAGSTLNISHPTHEGHQQEAQSSTSGTVADALQNPHTHIHTHLNSPVYKVHPIVRLRAAARRIMSYKNVRELAIQGPRPKLLHTHTHIQQTISPCPKPIKPSPRVSITSVSTSVRQAYPHTHPHTAGKSGPGSDRAQTLPHSNTQLNIELELARRNRERLRQEKENRLKKKKKCVWMCV